jgi:hypothetical protein
MPGSTAKPPPAAAAAAAAVTRNAGLFFAAYASLQVPSNILMTRIGGPVWLGIIGTGWGTVAACFSLVNSVPTFLVREHSSWQGPHVHTLATAAACQTVCPVCADRRRCVCCWACLKPVPSRACGRCWLTSTASSA